MLNNIANLIYGEKLIEKQNLNYTEILKKQFIKVLKNEHEKEGIVISLQGKWGIGKTYFWNNFAQHTWNENQHVYISLFGKHTLEDIKKQIILKVYDRNKLAKFIEKNPLISKFIENKWGVDASMVANTFTRDTFKGVVLCFDDFERISSNLNISEILGYISELKEQNKCKIVLINNNDSLREYDELNHSKTLEKDDKGARKELYITTKTNNQEIFNLFSEKIIDYSFIYEPHFNDNLELVVDKTIDFVDWELVSSLLAHVEDKNKQTNIRLLKQFVSKLRLFKDLLGSNTNTRICNSIVQHIFKNIFKIDNLYYLEKFNFTNISSLKIYLDDAMKKHYIEESSFQKSLKELNKKINKSDKYKEVYDDIAQKYHDFFYDLEYSETEFIHNVYKIMEENKEDIVNILDLHTFKKYIEHLEKLDSKNKNKYEELYVEAIQYYIDSISYQVRELYSHEENKKLYQDNDKLLKYYENKIRNLIQTENHIDVNEVINTMQERRKGTGWNKKDENFLNTISSNQHKEFILENKKYLQVCWDFINWINGFSGEKPFLDTLSNIKEALKELKKEDKYKNKLEFTDSFLEDNI